MNNTRLNIITKAAAVSAALLIAAAPLTASALDADAPRGVSVSKSGTSYGDFEYDFLSGGSIEIKKYNGTSDEVNVPAEIDGYKVTCIGWSAFKNCNSLRRVTLPDTVTSVGKWAFVECKNLREVRLSSNLLSVSAYAFSGCSSMESIELPRSLRVIGESAFASCSSLKSAVIYGSVVSVGEDAFFNCKSLRIKCCSDSYIHKYAVSNDIPFELFDGITGDADGDGYITANDAVTVLRQSVGISDGYSASFSDADGDGSITAADALMILRVSVGL